MQTYGWRNALRTIILLSITSLIALPILMSVMAGFKESGEMRAKPFALPEKWQLQYYGEILADPLFWGYMGNSMFIALTTVFMVLVLGSMAAFIFSHIHFVGSAFLFSYLLMGMMFPIAAGIVPLFIQVRDSGLLDTAWGVILPQTAFGLGFAVLLFRTFFDQMPKEMFEATRIDGCSYVRFFFKFTLPLSTPILATVGVFTFVTSWNYYFLPLIMLNSVDSFTLPLGMMQYRGEYIVEWNKILAFITLSLTPAIIFFLAAQKYIVAGLTGGAVKG